MPIKTKKVKEEPVIEPEFEYMEEAITSGEETFTFKRNHFYALITVFAFAAGILLGYVIWGFDSAVTTPVVVAPAGGPVVEAPVEEEPQFVRYEVASDGFPSIGPEDAPITIVEFSDYQCPFCKRWHDEVYQPLLNEYPGQIRLVYRHLPLTSLHPDAFPAAEAAMCAGEQNSYWPFHEKLFSRDALGSSLYVQYAQELGLDLNTFEACIAERRYQEAVQTDLDFAVDLGVRSTPTFFINGLAVVGAQPLDVFKQVIDKELAGEIPQ
ncbi:MAG TPA: DsbA family protein [Anaerolineales bacterium]|nr:DsbA family protein [Anaerolineales bacterium]